MKSIATRFIFVFFSLSFVGQTQTYLGFEYSPTIPVIRNGEELSNAWSGGINYGQFSSIDYNFDGLMDLVIFDRSADQFILLKHVQTGSNHHYEYVFNGHTHFPADCRYRVALLDYDQDGKNDLFTYGIGGIKVYRNVGNAIDGLQWQLVKPIVQTNYLGTLTNLFVSASDIPAYVDVDSDGDIDVLTFHLGGQNLEYHQNQSMELYGIPDSLEFVLKNQCWGKFSEDESSNALTLNQTAYPCSNGDIPNPQYPIIDTAYIFDEPKLHVGSTVLALDINGNGVMDLILGDVAYPNITLLINGGTSPNTNSAMISQDNQFPSPSNPGNMQLFPAIFWEDLDFDGIKDLVVTPNARTVSENQKSVQFFKNTGTNTLPNFTYVASDYLQRDMIDHGLGSIPVIVDVDGDGLKDLLIANFFRYKPILEKESVLEYYRNTGTSSQPEFTLISDNFLNFPSILPGIRVVPTFGDLDNDGDLDLVVGSDDGSIKLLTNNAGPNAPMSFNNPVVLSDHNNVPIQVASFSFPQLFDLNNDGLLDLIIGRKTGELTYYQNTGSSNSPQFTLISHQLGQVDASSTPDGYAAPHFFRVNDTTHLFLGSYEGTLMYYTNIDGNLNDGAAFTLYSSQLAGIDVGAYSSFFVDDLDNDELLNLFVGQDLGGLFHLEANPLNTAGLNETKINKSGSLFPNPGKNIIYFSANQNSNCTLKGVYNLLGQQQVVETEPNSFSAVHLPAGTYLVVLEVDGLRENHYFIKH